MPYDPTSSSPSSKVPVSPVPSADMPSNDPPIAINKGKCTCTQHPIANFVPYDHLSLGLHSFAFSLSSIFIPRFFQQAISISGWKHVMDEEMHALHKN